MVSKQHSYLSRWQSRCDDCVYVVDTSAAASMHEFHVTYVDDERAVNHDNSDQTDDHQDIIYDIDVYIWSLSTSS